MYRLLINFSGLTILLLTTCGAAKAVSAEETAKLEATSRKPEVLETDGKLRCEFGEERVVLPRALQPSLLVAHSGAIILQGQVPEKSFPSKRMAYPWAMSTRVSRDGGLSWTDIPLKQGENGLDMEGGIVQLRDGTILSLDTYIVPGERPDEGIGQLYTSHDDWLTVSGPTDVVFDLPRIEFYGSSDDGGRPHAAQRLHRRIIEMPNGDLLCTFYGWLKGDDSPSTYRPTMKKSRVMFARSSDRGLHWKLVASIADGDVGTEGFGEPVICRVSKGARAGRLICLMRTGRELRESHSDDGGATWSAHAPWVLAGLDVYKTELWVEMLRGAKDFKGKLLDENNLDELRGAVVDPDLIELRSGVLVAAFGVRVPQKLCWQHPEHPWNGNYLAFSRDHGETWSTVVRMTSGVLTTHYMAIEETPRDNELYVTYDLGAWSKGMRRDIVGRLVKVLIDAD
jgi:hypothetical protein